MRLSILACLLLCACAQQSKVTVVSSPYADGVEHKEPVFFTGKHYDVTFKFNTPTLAYDVTVEGQGRALGGSAEDRQIVEQVAASAVSHFACPSRQRAKVVPGSSRHSGTAWAMQARCG